MNRPTKRRVVVTGGGALTPLGDSLDTTWNAVLEGRRPAAEVRKFDASEYPCRIACEVDAPVSLPDLPEGEARFLSEPGRFAYKAAREAAEQSGLLAGREHVDPERLGVFLGVGMSGPAYDWYDRVYRPERADDETLDEYPAHFAEPVSSVIGRLVKAQGGITTVHTACASSGQALGEAYEAVAYGDLDLAVTGGTDSMIHPFYHGGFHLLQALSTRNDDPATASRPFDADRDGFVLGEGACVLVFEELEHAQTRGASILGEVCGYGVTESAYRITDMHPEGHGPLQAMQFALRDARVSPEQVGYVNAHGTSTPVGDRVESKAIAAAFGGPEGSCRVSSTKSMTGHMISSAGAVELAVCLRALQHEVLPPSVNVFNQDPECAVSLTPPEPTALRADYALSNSVGFGGSNTALVVGRYPR